MGISLRSVKMLMRKAAPEVPISDEAARLLRMHLEEYGQTLAEQAARIHQKENDLRRSIGERLKQRLSPKHVRMAVEGKFKEGGNRTDVREP